MYWEFKNDSFVLARADTTQYFCYRFGIGDIDRDGNTDIVGVINKKTYGIDYWLQVIESPDEHSFPSELRWEEKIEGWNPSLTALIDFDKDDKYEMWINVDWSTTRVWEQRYPNSEVSWNEVINREDTSWCGACGDFDNDGLMNFAAYTTFSTAVWENRGDNRYEKVWEDSAAFVNGLDVFSGDTDGDGVAELYINFYDPAGFSVFKFYLVWYRNTGNDSYEPVIIDSIPYPMKLLGPLLQSDCGDVDGDGRDEIVWACAKVVYVLDRNDDGSFERKWWWYNNLGKYTNECAKILCHDFNKNGYDEIVIGGEYRTAVYEIEWAGIEEREGHELSCMVGKGALCIDCPPGIKEVEIYDMTGRLVRVFKNPSCRLYWDGRDKKGRRLSSGIYFVRIRKEEKSLIKKVLLVR